MIRRYLLLCFCTYFMHMHAFMCLHLSPRPHMHRLGPCNQILTLTSLIADPDSV
jgi:hypothetical protein